MNYKFVLVDSDTGMPAKQWILPPPVLIGRCPTADITIDDPSISRRHCQFIIDPHGSLAVRDLGSKNGVFVEQRRVEKAIVRPGSEIRIGTVTMRAELTEQEKDTTGQPPSTVSDTMAETQAVRIIRPEDDIYDIG